MFGLLRLNLFLISLDLCFDQKRNFSLVESLIFSTLISNIVILSINSPIEIEAKILLVEFITC